MQAWYVVRSLVIGRVSRLCQHPNSLPKSPIFRPLSSSGFSIALAANPPEGVLELVPAARTVLVRLDPRVLGLTHAEHWLRAAVSVRARSASL